jgi:predicted ATPase
MTTQQQEMQQELERVEREYAGRSDFARGQARMAATTSLSAMEDRYGQDMLTHASHGESFLRLFQSRMVPGGLYLLDEPEGPLSPLRQMALFTMLHQLTERDACQFIIATHSPILMALPSAQLFTFDTQPMSTARFSELPSVSLLRDFLAAPEQFVHQLTQEE